MTESRSSGEAFWAIDADGARTLASLTVDETSEYFSLLHAEAEVSCREAQDRLRALRERHQKAMPFSPAAAPPRGHPSR